MAAARAGDDRAFEQLYGRYQRRIAAYVHGMVKDHGRSEDITQEVFMSALRRMRKTDSPINFKPWVYEIAKNACIDAFRRSRRTDEVSFDADEGLGAGDHLKLVSKSPTPDAAVDARMTLDDLRGAFGGLSEAHHDILVMRELEGRSYREIGEKLGMSRSSVESTLFRARRRLTEEYGELVSGKRCEQFQGLIAQAADVRLGARDERKMARHVSHCQPCRRVAGLAGLDIAAMAEGRGMRAKIAALLPLPAFLKRRWLPDGDGGDGGAGGSLGNWTSMAAQYAEPMSGWAKAATVAATVALAGAGAGVATSQGDSKPAVSGPASAAPAAASPGAQPTSSSAATTSADRFGATRGGTTTQQRSAGSSSTGEKPSSGAARGGSSDAGASDRGGSGSASSTVGSASNSVGTVADRATGAAGNAVKTTVPKAVGGATGAVDQVTTTTGKAVDKVTGTVTGTVKKTTETATGTATGVTKTATDAVPKTTGAVTGTVDKATNGATSGVSGTVDKTATTAAGAAQGAVGTATGAAGSATGTATGAVQTTATTATGLLP